MPSSEKMEENSLLVDINDTLCLARLSRPDRIHKMQSFQGLLRAHYEMNRMEMDFRLLLLRIVCSKGIIFLMAN